MILNDIKVYFPFRCHDRTSVLLYNSIITLYIDINASNIFVSISPNSLIYQIEIRKVSFK